MSNHTGSRAGLRRVRAPRQVALVLGLFRLGVVAGLVARVLGSDRPVGADAWLILALHLLGAAATVVIVAAGLRAGVAIAVLYTGYSTVALGLSGAPAPLGSVIWISGGLVLPALVWYWISLSDGPSRPSGSPDPSRPALSGPVVAVRGLAFGAAALVGTALALI